MSGNLNQPNGNLAVNLIPMPKLTTMINDFIVKTVNHLNKLSVHVETKLATYDNKLKEIEIMVTLLESKLNSLPSEITSKYQDLTHCSLNDINPEINPVENVNRIETAKEVVNQNNPTQHVENIKNDENPPVQVLETIKEEEPVEETPEQKLNNFVEQNKSEDLDRLYRMLKMGIPEQAVSQKASLSGFDQDLTTTLLDLFKKSNPNLVF